MLTCWRSYPSTVSLKFRISPRWVFTVIVLLFTPKSYFLISSTYTYLNFYLKAALLELKSLSTFSMLITINSDNRSLPKMALKLSFQYVALSISNVCMDLMSTICTNYEILYTSTIGPIPPYFLLTDFGNKTRSSRHTGASSTMKVYL